VQHFRSLEAVSLQKSWLTIGVFDGVHRGHQEIIRRLTAGAHAEGLPAVVLTFYPHPAIVLGGRTDFKYLTAPEEKVALLGNLGVDVVISHIFNLQLAAQTAEEFMARVMTQLGPRHLLVGYDFALGRDREGDFDRLSELGLSLGYDVQPVMPLTNEAEVISSSRIRARLAAGEVAEAAADLGRFYALSGPVVHGDGRGRKINIPTANIDVHHEKFIPANGVYACWAYVSDERYPAVTNIGIRPTFTPEVETPHVETHLLDFQRELYGQEIRLEFAARLRDEQRFPSAEALIAQINRDIARSRELLPHP